MSHEKDNENLGVPNKSKEPCDIIPFEEVSQEESIQKQTLQELLFMVKDEILDGYLQTGEICDLKNAIYMIRLSGIPPELYQWRRIVEIIFSQPSAEDCYCLLPSDNSNYEHYKYSYQDVVNELFRYLKLNPSYLSIIIDFPTSKLDENEG